MRRRREKNGIVGVVAGPIIVFLALAALWKNEVRYDYYHAARNSMEVNALGDANEAQVISYTGGMDQGLELNGKYIDSFSGYLVIDRKAEIYCWDRSEDDDGHVTWRREWKRSIESNARNHGLHQQLSSGRLIPESYRVDDFEIMADRIEFVDRFEAVAPGGVKAELPVSPNLTQDGNYLMLRKNKAGKLGDERISYRGFPVPATATWFGRYAGGKGVAHDANQRDGFVNGLIQDTGILHHLVAGDRATALATTRQYLSRLKWIVRAAGTCATYIGFQVFFSSIVGFVFGVPIVGWLAEKGTIILSIVVAVPLALITIVCGFLFGHLYLFLVLLSVLTAIVAFLVGSRRKGERVSRQLHQTLEEKYGRKLDFNDIKEMEFAELAHLALGDAKVGNQELDLLYKWGKKNGWKKDKVDELLQAVRGVGEVPASDHPSDWHLNQLIQLALADGHLTPFEMRVIRVAAKKAGHDRQTVKDLMARVKQAAA